MKNLSPLKLILSFIFVATLISCGSDDDTETEEASLVGVWQRSDFGETDADGGMHDYRLSFSADENGHRTHAIEFEDGTGSSSLSTFNWSETGDQLTIIYDISNEEVTTSFSFSANGQLLLNGISNLPFNSIEE